MALESVLFSVARLAALPARGQPSINSLITLRERIRFDQIGLVKHLGLAIRLPLADAELAPQMMVAIVNSHVPFGRPFEFHAGRSRGNLVNVEAAALFDRFLPQPRTEIRGLRHVTDDGLLAVLGFERFDKPF